MTDRRLARLALRLLDRATDAFPRVAPRMVERVLLASAGSALASAWCAGSERRRAARAPPGPVLFVADCGIGDALLLQGALGALRERFPGARVDYACSRVAGDLVETGHGAHRVYPVLTASGRLSPEDRGRLEATARAGGYALVVNFCPFVPRAAWPEGLPCADLYRPLAARLLRARRTGVGELHVGAAAGALVLELFGPGVPASRAAAPQPSLLLSGEAAGEARAWLDGAGLRPGAGLVLHNPDASCAYSRVPPELQARVLGDLAASPRAARLLLASGQASPGVEQAVLGLLPPGARRKARVVPPLSLAAFAALADAADVFISGDGGAVHVAAARKSPAAGAFVPRNRTAVVSLFGASDARMYGYDSMRPGHAAAPQDAPSAAFSAPAPCRNVTCVNKLGKHCRTVRCFEGLDTAAVAGFARSWLEHGAGSGR